MPTAEMYRSTEHPSTASGSPQSLPSRDSVLGDAVVLVCDRDESLRANVEGLLRAAGFKGIVGAASSADAAALCPASPPDVILYRVKQGDDAGPALTDSLRALNPNGRLSVIYLCTDGIPERKALLSHGDDCLSLEHDLPELPRRVLVHATLHVVERTLSAERCAMEEIIDQRTKRLNKALDLLREAEKRLENELSAAKTETRERIDYFAETQHELRTPLNAICGMSDAIRAEMFGAIDNAKYKDYADNIYQAGQHLLSIIDGRLELSRIEAGAEPLEVEDVDVGGVIHETTEMLSRLAEKAKVSLNIDIEPDLPVIATDRRKLRQVLVNLVSNAIKFTPEDGRVLMSVKRNAKKGVLVLVVSDTGIGMSAADVHDAMKPYRRLSGDRRSGERGTGLGLSIVRKLVETLGATIEIQSTPGQGTSIKVELPMAAPGSEQPLEAAG